jgi:hypothetical protein
LRWEGLGQKKGKCWDKVASAVDIFFNSHVRLRRELQLRLVDVRVALEKVDVETAKRIDHEFQVLLDL